MNHLGRSRLRRGLVRAVDVHLRNFASRVLADFDKRLRDGGPGLTADTEGNPEVPENPKRLSLWDLLTALELADPTIRTVTQDRTWDAVDLICDRFDLSAREVKKQIVTARQLGRNLGEEEKDLAKSNLLCLMEKLEKRTRWSALPHFFKFVKATFCILVSSTLIESCFSVFQALKGKDRSSLGDGRVLEALLSREAVDVFANGAVGFDELRLRDDSRNHRVPW